MSGTKWTALSMAIAMIALGGFHLAAMSSSEAEQSTSIVDYAEAEQVLLRAIDGFYGERDIAVGRIAVDHCRIELVLETPGYCQESVYYSRVKRVIDLREVATEFRLRKNTREEHPENYTLGFRFPDETAHTIRLWKTEFIARRDAYLSQGKTMSEALHLVTADMERENPLPLSTSSEYKMCDGGTWKSAVPHGPALHVRIDEHDSLTKLINGLVSDCRSPQN